MIPMPDVHQMFLLKLLVTVTQPVQTQIILRVYVGPYGSKLVANAFRLALMEQREYIEFSVLRVIDGKSICLSSLKY